MNALLSVIIVNMQLGKIASKDYFFYQFLINFYHYAIKAKRKKNTQKYIQLYFTYNKILLVFFTYYKNPNAYTSFKQRIFIQ